MIKMYANEWDCCYWCGQRFCRCWYDDEDYERMLDNRRKTRSKEKNKFKR